MKSIIKFIHVLLGVILFLTISYGIQTIQDSDLVNTSQEESFEDTSSKSNNTDSDSLESSDNQEETSSVVAKEPSKEEDSDHSTMVSEDTPVTETETEDSIIAEDEEPPIFDYNMEAIDHHTVDHLDDMIKVIAEYNSAPTTDFSDLYNLLYTRNYMHIEKELAEKNVAIHEFMLESLDALKATDETMVESVTSSLTIIEEILISLKNVE